MKTSRLVASALWAGAFSSSALAQEGRQAQLDAMSVSVRGLRSGAPRRGDSSKAVVTVNGKPVSLGGMSLLQVHGRLLVPLRALGQVLDASLSFDSASQTVTAIRAGYTLRLQEATVVAGHTFVPLRALSESLGVQVVASQTPHFLRISLDTTRRAGENAASPSLNTAPRVSATPQMHKSVAVTNGITQANIQHNLNGLNALRAKAGVSPLQLDPGLCAFALQGSLELLQTHTPHGHFKAADVWKSGFINAAAENQGDPRGWFPGAVNRSIDEILQAMISEGPGGGHHDNILNPAYPRVGIGLVKDKSGRLYLTNDFSG